MFVFRDDGSVRDLLIGISGLARELTAKIGETLPWSAWVSPEEHLFRACAAAHCSSPGILPINLRAQVSLLRPGKSQIGTVAFLVDANIAGAGFYAHRGPAAIQLAGHMVAIGRPLCEHFLVAVDAA